MNEKNHNFGIDDQEMGHLDFKQKIDKKIKSWTDALSIEGFNLRPYRAEWSNTNQLLIITRPDGSILKLSDGEIADVIEGIKELDPADMGEFDRWYKVSGYRVGHEGYKAEVRMGDADTAPIEKVEEVHDYLYQATDEQAIAERGKAQLAYLYNETDPARIDRLYQLKETILFGRDDK